MRFLFILILTFFMALPLSYALDAMPLTNLGQVTVNDVETATATFESMLKTSSPRLFRVDWKNDSLSTTLLPVSEDRASENMKTSKNFFRLHYYQEENSPTFIHYVDQADASISSLAEFNRFLMINKGKTYNHLTLKLNNYDAKKKYLFPNNMGLRGAYDIHDDKIAGGAVLRTITRNISYDQVSEKKYKATTATAFQTAMRDALQHFYTKVIIETPSLSDKTYDVGKFYRALKRDTPEVEFTTSLHWETGDLRTRKNTGGKIVTSHQYTYTLMFNYPASRLINQKAMNASSTKVDAIVKEVITAGMTDYEKIKALHDYLVTHTTYDKMTAHFDLPTKKSYLISAPLLDGTSVCSGYAWAMQALLNKVGISNLVVSGDAVPSVGASSERHAWNMVKVSGSYYHLDSTWDDLDGSENACHYGYFLVDDTTLSKNHFWEKSNYPACLDNSLEYYNRNHLVADDKTTFQRIMAAYMATDSNNFRFRSENYSPSWIDGDFRTLVLKHHPTWTLYHVEIKNAGGVYTLSLTGE